MFETRQTTLHTSVAKAEDSRLPRGGSPLLSSVAREPVVWWPRPKSRLLNGDGCGRAPQFRCGRRDDFGGSAAGTYIVLVVVIAAGVVVTLTCMVLLLLVWLLLLLLLRLRLLIW